MGLRPIPERREFRRRSFRASELFPMLREHFRERHSIGTCPIRISTALEEGMRVGVSDTILRPAY